MRSQWQEWKEIATVLLAKAKETQKYKESKLSHEQCIDKLDGLLIWFESDIQNRAKDRETCVDRKKFEEAIAMAENILIKHQEKRDSYSEKENQLIENLISFCFNKYGRAFYKSASWTILNEYNGTIGLRWMDKWVTLFKNHFSYLSQEEKEKLTLLAVENCLYSHNDYGLEKEVLNGCWYYNVQKSYHNAPSWIWSNGTEYLFSSKWHIEDIIKRTLEQSSNEEYIYDMICLMAKYRFGSYHLPENVKILLSDSQNVKKIINGQRFQKNKVYLWEVLSLLKDAGVKVSLNDAIEFKNLADIKYEKDYSPIRGDFFEPIRNIQPLLKSIVREKDWDDIFASIIKEGKIDQDMIKKAKKTFNSNEILAKIPREYLKVAFINSNMDDLKDLLDSKGVEYLLSAIDLSDDWKKLDEKILENFKITELIEKIDYSRNRDVYSEDFNRLSKSREVAKLIVKKVQLSKLPYDGGDSYIYYDELNKTWMINEENIKRFSLRTFAWPYYNYKDQYNNSAYVWWDNSKVRANFMSENVLPVVGKYVSWYIDVVLNSDNIKEIRELVKCINYFPNSITESQMNLLVERVIKSIKTIDDLQYVENLFTTKTNHYSIIIYLAFCIYNTYPWEYGEYTSGRRSAETSLRRENLNKLSGLPKSVYSEMLKKDIFLDITKLPKVLQDPMIENFDNVIQLILERNIAAQKESEEKKLEEERLTAKRNEMIKENLRIQEAAIKNSLENKKEWDCVINYTREWQKYVLSLNIENSTLYFLTEDLPYHANIHGKYCDKWTCLGWWRIKIDKEKKAINLYDYSQWYGSIDSKFHGAMKKIIEKNYPWYEIIIR